MNYSFFYSISKVEKYMHIVDWVLLKKRILFEILKVFSYKFKLNFFVGWHKIKFFYVSVNCVTRFL